MTPKNVNDLEDLFEMFGVPMKVADNSLNVLGRAYDVFALGLGLMVARQLIIPSWNFEGWPEDWADYLRAVVAGDKLIAREWAQKLQPLAPGCVFPDEVPKLAVKLPGAA